VKAVGLPWTFHDPSRRRTDSTCDVNGRLEKSLFKGNLSLSLVSGLAESWRPWNAKLTRIGRRGNLFQGQGELAF